ncbi:MAG TPA: hypothetical protein VE131_09660 [Terriglobales bacterium]|nr:hypothetical protein [Terriglobales bacterium]
MANLYYKDRLIVAYASFNQSSKDWSGGAEITWKQDGRRYSHSIASPKEHFKTSEDAESFLTRLAMTWIDRNSPAG